jgi:excisionase family DNA binding protein
MGEGLMNYEEAAKYLATNTRHIRRLWAERRLAAVKIGRQVRFRREDLDAYIKRNLRPAIR